VDALARQAPVWAPGTAHGYHAATYRWLVGDLVRRITRSVARHGVRGRVARPLGLEFWIGLPAGPSARAAEVPAANGVTNAHSVERMYAACIGAGT
jgi:CubicO group peptidase (beta-lactamase class C family)